MENLNEIRNIWLNLKIENKPFNYKDVFSKGDIIIQLIYTRETHVIRMKLDSNVAFVSMFGNIKFKGIDIKYQEHESTQIIDIILFEESLTSPFNGFILDFLSNMKGVNESEPAVKCLLSTLQTWINFFKSISSKKLTEEEQLGLYGELFFIKKLIDKSKNINDVIERWLGPDRNDKDFVFDNVLIEVKATKVKAPVIKITSENQLNNPSQTDFFLSLFVFDIIPGKTDTLNSIIELISGKMNNHSIDIFNERLEEVGYYIKDKEHYFGKRYVLRDNLNYKVIDKFPKIIYGKVMEGIHNVEYSIQPSACSSFKKDFEEITNLI